VIATPMVSFAGLSFSALGILLTLLGHLLADDCLDDLVCYQRDNDEMVPGCIGIGLVSYDYCIVDPENTNRPQSTVDYGSNPEVSISSAVYLITITTETNGGTTSAASLSRPLGLCQGDCSADADCLDDLV